MPWVDVLAADALAAAGKAVVRHDGRQILVLQTERGLYACANRCPHEGYPLSEGF
jgi:nitrite reductase/ring-hydroxylating ferredoxin subunit